MAGLSLPQRTLRVLHDGRTDKWNGVSVLLYLQFINKTEINNGGKQ
jgi:hypothetical protein